MNQAFVFPGQGSQNVGMGKDFFETYPVAKEVFEEVDDTLAPFYGKKLSDVIFEGPMETLTQTLYTQVALMATSIAMYRTLEKELGGPLSHSVSFMAGHSLGEYSALCAAGVLSLRDTALLLYYRGKAMTECVPKGGGAMAAIMGLEMKVMETITQEAGCFVANDNGGGQVVISGTMAAVTEAMESAQKAGAKRAISLPVSAPFHCPLMEEAAEVMAEKIANISFHDAATPIITNVSATAHTQMFQSHLVDQICGRVRWRESILYMEKYGVTHITEIGAGKVLTNLCKRIAPSITTLSVSTVQDCETYHSLYPFTSERGICYTG